MKKLIQFALLLAAAALLFSCCACSKVDVNYGASASAEQTSSDTPIEIPEIKSSDTVMPIFFDISLYDEEDYAQIYLGKKFKFKITYGGSELSVPTDYPTMQKKGWSLLDAETYNDNSTILAGETLETQLVSEYGKQLAVTFYNESHSSVKLSKCPIVRLAVKENSLNTETVYDQFWVNGVSNLSAVTDVIEALGAPSHFEALESGEYRLDYFLTREDRRNKIVVDISVENDCVNGIEVARYS